MDWHLLTQFIKVIIEDKFFVSLLRTEINKNFNTVVFFQHKWVKKAIFKVNFGV